MNPTELRNKMIREALAVLHEVGLPHVEWLLYGAVADRVRPRPTVSDFEQALREAEKRKWVIGITAHSGDRKWAITDAGEAARREFEG